MSNEQYEKDKKEVMIKLGVALQQMGIGYPDIAFDCIEKTQKRLLKYVGITEEQRKHLKELEYDSKSVLLVSTDPKERDGWDADETAAIKRVALGKEVRQITEAAIAKVINAGIALSMVGDLSAAEARKEIEGCLEKMKKDEKI